LEQQRLSITGDADVKFSFVVFIVGVVLAAGLISTGPISDRLAVVAAISIGRNFS